MCVSRGTVGEVQTRHEEKDFSRSLLGKEKAAPYQDEAENRIIKMVKGESRLHFRAFTPSFGPLIWSSEGWGSSDLM